MRKKFGGYTVDYKKVFCGVNTDAKTVDAIIQITGDIEIGIKIERMTWREDWLKEVLFRNNASKYRIVHLENNFIQYSPVEVNEVTVRFSYDD